MACGLGESASYLDMTEMCEWGVPDVPQTDVFGEIRRKLAFGAHCTHPKRQCSPVANVRRAPNVNTRRPLLPPRDKRRRSRRDGDPSPFAFRAQRSGVEKSRHEISPLRRCAPPVEMTTTQPNGRIGRDDKGTAQRSLQSKALRYSLKPVNDSMRPPHVLLLSDSNPYSPKVNSMM